MTESNLGNLDSETIKLITQYVDSWKQRVEEHDKARIEQSQRMLDQQLAQAVQKAEWMRLVDLPARGLTRFFIVPGVWGKLPDFARTNHAEKIKDWVDRAKAGDKVAQAVLLRSGSILEQNKVSTEGIPSFSWQEVKKE